MLLIFFLKEKIDIYIACELLVDLKLIFKQKKTHQPRSLV